MKMKNLIVRLSIVFILVIIVFSLVLNASTTNERGFLENKLEFIGDTLKPEYTQEKRITKIEIINGKKKIIEKIIKMRGDSIVEERTIEKEEDVSGDNPSFNLGGDDQMSGRFEFRNINPSEIDSMFSQNFKQFNFGSFGNDSLGHGFNFSFGPDFQFNFGDSFLNENLFEQFGLHDRTMDPNMEKQFEKMFKGFNSDKLHSIPAPNSEQPENKGFKTLKQIISEQLVTDGFIANFDDSYNFKLNENGLKINGKKQNEGTFKKYKEIIEDNIGIELENEFEYNFSNSKSLKNNLIRL